ncbi:alpha-ketoglutarate-dependent dioxygenase alkB homolog 4 [Synchiropus splendidus]|uniref:alpha-ketoglutarate-dependent dioxygenase alkB homolog 4 n=1 Tax=Synchiropus splendidus TaxID=270530 RepID=UPI00237DD022|nr:alpha-ketoglutarate-dependent dioxygenase alkB homolog 4 [Synchiropus splendidus]
MAAAVLPGGVRSCACKGVRRCLVCETSTGDSEHSTVKKTVHLFIYDPKSGLATRSSAEPSSFPFPGVVLRENFISEEEEEKLVHAMDHDTWIPSQSGRWKQDFGPKVNFKKRKIRVGIFSGLPPLSQKLVARMQLDLSLRDFQPVEQCNLDYRPQRGSAIDPHLDDSWLWGERLVTVNMLSDTVLTMTLEQGLPELNLAEEVHVCVKLPRRSLLVLHGEARHRWKHAIQRKDIQQRRVCSTYRELSAEFLPGGEQADLGKQLLNVALSFEGSPVNVDSTQPLTKSED